MTTQDYLDDYADQMPEWGCGCETCKEMARPKVTDEERRGGIQDCRRCGELLFYRGEEHACEPEPFGWAHVAGVGIAIFIAAWVFAAVVVLT